MITRNVSGFRLTGHGYDSSIRCMYKNHDLFLITNGSLWDEELPDMLVVHRWEYLFDDENDIDLCKTGDGEDGDLYVIKIDGVDVI